MQQVTLHPGHGCYRRWIQMVFLHNYEAAVKGKITSDHHLHTYGPSLPKQFIFPKDIGKELLPPASLHLSGVQAAHTSGVDSKCLGHSGFQAMRTTKK